MPEKTAVLFGETCTLTIIEGNMDNGAQAMPFSTNWLNA